MEKNALPLMIVYVLFIMATCLKQIELEEFQISDLDTSKMCYTIFVTKNLTGIRTHRRRVTRNIGVVGVTWSG